MSRGFSSQRNDPDLDRVSAALLRAGQRARELARWCSVRMPVRLGRIDVATVPELKQQARLREAARPPR